MTAGTGGRDPVLADENAARQAIVETCLRMGSLGLNTGRAGNVSLRWHRGGPRGEGLLITPAAMPYEQMRAADIVWLPLAGDSGDVPAAAAPARRPSSEWRLHRDILRSRPEVGAVVHVHSPAATALACLPRIQREGIPAFHYMVAVAGGADIRCAPYRLFGSADLSQEAVTALVDRRACLLANHGTVACGATLAAALELSGEVEALAHMYALTLQLSEKAGEPVVLGDEEIGRVLARFADYRGEASGARDGESA